MKSNKIVCNILAVLGYFYGVALIATLILMPVGIYSIIAARRFSDYSEMNGVELAMHKNALTGWVIFACILYFPFGLISLLTLKSVSNEISVTTVEEKPSETKQEAVEVEVLTPTSDEEKKEKLEKLKRFKENGLITEEEFNQAKAELEEK